MKNLSPWILRALRLRLLTLRRQAVGKALLPYHPVGWCAGIQGMDGEPVYAWGGEARIGVSPVTRDTIFRVASVSKLFGAAASLQLVREGKLALDTEAAPIVGFDTGKPITLRQLLTHTAGIHDVLAYDRALAQDHLPPLSDVLPHSFAAYAPGTRFHYSNLGAGVAGMMVEAASGQSFDAYVRETFFTPYGIDASFHPQHIRHRERMANCYRVPGQALAYDAQAIAEQPLDDVPDPLRHYTVPAGKLMISAPDLLASLRRLFASVPEMFERQDLIGSVRCDSGRGLGTAFTPEGVFAPGCAFWGHQGTAYGALCEAWIDTEDGTCAVLLTNGMKLSSIGPLYKAGQSGMAALLADIP